MCQREWVSIGGGVSERNRLQDDVCTIKYWICMYLWLYLSKKDSVLRVELGEREREREIERHLWILSHRLARLKLRC